MDLSNWPKRDELIEIYTGNNDLTVDEMAVRLGISAPTVRRYAHELRIFRHPETIKRQRRAIGERNKLINRMPDSGVLPAIAHWPPHTFADQNDPRAEAECRGNFVRLKPAPNATLGGVPSGWEA